MLPSQGTAFCSASRLRYSWPLTRRLLLTSPSNLHTIPACRPFCLRTRTVAGASPQWGRLHIEHPQWGGWQLLPVLPTDPTAIQTGGAAQAPHHVGSQPVICWITLPHLSLPSVPRRSFTPQPYPSIYNHIASDGCGQSAFSLLDERVAMPCSRTLSSYITLGVSAVVKFAITLY